MKRFYLDEKRPLTVPKSSVPHVIVNDGIENDAIIQIHKGHGMISVGIDDHVVGIQVGQVDSVREKGWKLHFWVLIARNQQKLPKPFHTLRQFDGSFQQVFGN